MEVAFDERATFFIIKSAKKKKSQVQRGLTGQGFPLMKVSLTHQPDNGLPAGLTLSESKTHTLHLNFLIPCPQEFTCVCMCESPSPPSPPNTCFGFFFG